MSDDWPYPQKPEPTVTTGGTVVPDLLTLTVSDLVARIKTLEAEVARLRAELERLKAEAHKPAVVTLSADDIWDLRAKL